MHTNALPSAAVIHRHHHTVAMDLLRSAVDLLSAVAILQEVVSALTHQEVMEVASVDIHQEAAMVDQATKTFQLVINLQKVHMLIHNFCTQSKKF
jgi:hypothetical protein